MKKEELFTILNDVDEKLLSEAETLLNAKKRTSYRKWIFSGAVAACAAVMILGGLHLREKSQKEKEPVIYSGAYVYSTSDDVMDGMGPVTEEGAAEDAIKEEVSEESYAEESWGEAPDAVYPESTIIDTGRLTELTQDYYGGCYLNPEGQFTIVIVGDTPEHRKYIAYELGVSEKELAWVEGEYTYAYLNELHSKITEKMVNKEFSFICTSGVYDMENRVMVEVLASYEGSLDALMELDTQGGALVINQVSAGVVTDDVLIAE